MSSGWSNSTRPPNFDYWALSSGGFHDVSFGTDQSFLAWSSNSPSQVATARKAPGRKPEVQLPASRLTRASHQVKT